MTEKNLSGLGDKETISLEKLLKIARKHKKEYFTERISNDN